MSDILCIYYSRTGSTRAAMTEIANTLNAELVELKDGVNRSGFGGWLRHWTIWRKTRTSRWCLPGDRATVRRSPRLNVCMTGSPPGVWIRSG